MFCKPTKGEQETCAQNELQRELSNTTELPEMLPKDDPGWMLEREVAHPMQD